MSIENSGLVNLVKMSIENSWLVNLVIAIVGFPVFSLYFYSVLPFFGIFLLGFVPEGSEIAFLIMAYTQHWYSPPLLIYFIINVAAPMFIFCKLEKKSIRKITEKEVIIILIGTILVRGFLTFIYTSYG